MGLKIFTFETFLNFTLELLRQVIPLTTIVIARAALYCIDSSFSQNESF